LTTKQRINLERFMKERVRSGREVRRVQAVLLIDEDVVITAITTLTGYKKRQIFTLRKKFLTTGTDVLKDQRKGKPKELLTKKQREEIITTIQTKKPSDCDTYFKNYNHWTTGVLGEYIKRVYKAEYKSKTSHYLLFREAQFTYHKPGRVYHEQDQEEIKRWKKQVKPKLKSLWQEKDTVILTADEMILTTATTTQKIWLKAGEYPKIEVSNGTRKRKNLYGFLDIRTGVQHVWKTDKQNMYVTADILKKVRAKYPDQRIVLFWDSAGWHKGSVVQESINKDTNITIIHFPRYAPELNPQEHVWKKGRTQCTHNKFIEDIDVATDEFVKYLRKTKFPYSLLGFSAVS
jgi:transposase